jgi:hypothetical protein
MKELFRNAEYMYKLYQNGEQLVMSVVCGGIGMYEVRVVLNEEERLQYVESGDSFLNELAYDIAKNTQNYLQRKI